MSLILINYISLRKKLLRYLCFFNLELFYLLVEFCDQPLIFDLLVVKIVQLSFHFNEFDTILRIHQTHWFFVLNLPFFILNMFFANSHFKSNSRNILLVQRLSIHESIHINIHIHEMFQLLSINILEQFDNIWLTVITNGLEQFL